MVKVLESSVCPVVLLTANTDMLPISILVVLSAVRPPLRVAVTSWKLIVCWTVIVDPDPGPVVKVAPWTPTLTSVEPLNTEAQSNIHGPEGLVTQKKPNPLHAFKLHLCVWKDTTAQAYTGRIQNPIGVLEPDVESSKGP